MVPPDFARVLLIEDNPSHVEHLTQILHSTSARGSFQLLPPVATLAEAMPTLEQKGGADVVLLDGTLYDGEWLSTLARVRQVAVQVAVIVLWEQDDEELKVLALREGAQDFLGKAGLDERTLLKTMRYAVERSRAVQPLLEEHEMFRTLLDYMPDRIYFKDQHSRFTRANLAIARYFSLESPDEMIGKTDFDFFDPAHARPAFEDEQRIMKTGQMLEARIEKEILPDGRVGWVSTTKLPMRNRRGHVIGTFGISHDITHIKEMEDALAAERTLLRNVINHVLDPIYLKDREGRYQLDNTAHLNFLGRQSAEEIVGKTVFDFFPEAVAEHFHAGDEAILQSGEALLNHEEIATDSEGRRRWLLTTKVPLRDEKNAIAGLVCIGRDITEQKEAEEKLVESNASLVNALHELKSAHEQLSSVQMQLIEAEKMKSVGRLAAGVAHEVKNPLQIIMMGLTYFREKVQPEDEHGTMVVREMAEATKRADNVVRGLLDFSVPKKLEAKEEDMNDVIADALLLIRGELTAAGQTLVKELAPDLPRLALDRTKIGQVLVNLFSNAIQAMPEGGTLTVRSRLSQLTGVGANIGDERSALFRAGDNLIVVEVCDTGSGIPERQLGKVFDPFFTTKPTGKGTGLGLTVTRTIMDLHNGIIDLANRPEGGACATLTFKV